ncbi:hypothetical protein FRC02_002342 [Tulasnella sp. 418]|nr:hypothetical protein FRC02_002342 [Tulasnella sp. 418]
MMAILMQCGKSQWFWWFDTTHPSVPFYLSPRQPHPPNPAASHGVTAAIHPPALFFPYAGFPFPFPFPAASPSRTPEDTESTTSQSTDTAGTKDLRMVQIPLPRGSTIGNNGRLSAFIRCRSSSLTCS